MSEASSKSSIDFFIKELKEAKPSPGGGAVAALAGALGMALIVKVANFSIGKKRYEKHEREIKSILLEADGLRGELSLFIEKDAKAYKEYSLTKSAASMKKATQCMVNVSRLSSKGLKFCWRLERIGNVNLKGDLYVAERLLNSSIKSADNLSRLNKKTSSRNDG
ncbi:MAG: cyclodeaminase/cyclohydrolase family protein [Candidatus Omnitrophota bacterium]